MSPRHEKKILEDCVQFSFESRCVVSWGRFVSASRVSLAIHPA